jgi:hypothetical protein
MIAATIAGMTASRTGISRNTRRFPVTLASPDSLTPVKRLAGPPGSQARRDVLSPVLA